MIIMVALCWHPKSYDDDHHDDEYGDYGDDDDGDDEDNIDGCCEIV